MTAQAGGWPWDLNPWPIRYTHPMSYALHEYHITNVSLLHVVRSDRDLCHHLSSSGVCMTVDLTAKDSHSILPEEISRFLRVQRCSDGANYQGWRKNSLDNVNVSGVRRGSALSSELLWILLQWSKAGRQRHTKPGPVKWRLDYFILWESWNIYSKVIYNNDFCFRFNSFRTPPKVMGPWTHMWSLKKEIMKQNKELKLKINKPVV